MKQKKVLNRRIKMTKYKFDDEDKSIEPIPVIITEGRCEGVKIQYGRIAFDEIDGNMQLNFDYNLVENPNNLEEDQEFITNLGEVLVSVLEDEMEYIGEDFLKTSEEEIMDEEVISDEDS